MTQDQILIKYLTGKDWTYSYQLIKVNTPWGFLGTSADRRARTLRERGVLEEKREGKYVMYRVKELPKVSSVKSIASIIGQSVLFKS
jgi:DNA-binding transcriptional ArsR family regulator